MNKNTSNNGFTLVEALIAMVILAIAAAAILLPFASSAEVALQGRNLTLAAKLASDLTEQIIAADFAAIVPTYGAYSEPQGQIKSAAGTTIADPMYKNFSRTASCQYFYMPQQNNSYGNPNFIKITVSVYENSVKTAELVRIKSK